MAVRPLPTLILLVQQGLVDTHSRRSPWHTEIPKDLGWGPEVGPRAIKCLPLPSPTPPPPQRGPTLGSGKTQKTGSICANNSAATSVCAAQGNGAAGLAARSRRRPGRALRLEHPWTPPELSRALFAQPPEQELRAPQIKRLRRWRRN